MTETKFVLRIPKDLHEMLKQVAAKNYSSVNSHLLRMIDADVGSYRGLSPSSKALPKGETE